MGKTLHIGWKDEVEPARASGTPIRVLCGRQAIPPEVLDMSLPVCRTCEKAKAVQMRTSAPAVHAYKVWIGNVYEWKAN